jgi:hypothetical protein
VKNVWGWKLIFVLKQKWILLNGNFIFKNLLWRGFGAKCRNKILLNCPELGNFSCFHPIDSISAFISIPVTILWTFHMIPLPNFLSTLWILIQSGNILNSHTDLIEFPLQFPCNGRSNLWTFYFYWRNHIDISSIQWFIYYFSTSYKEENLWWKTKKFLRLEWIYCKKYCYCLVTNLIEMMEVIRMSRKW